MKNVFRIASLLAIFSLLYIRCSKDDDLFVPDELRLNDFIWKGMNQYYLWQNDVAN